MANDGAEEITQEQLNSFVQNVTELFATDDNDAQIPPSLLNIAAEPAAVVKREEPNDDGIKDEDEDANSFGVFTVNIVTSSTWTQPSKKRRVATTDPYMAAEEPNTKMEAKDERKPIKCEIPSPPRDPRLRPQEPNAGAAASAGGTRLARGERRGKRGGWHTAKNFLQIHPRSKWPLWHFLQDCPDSSKAEELNDPELRQQIIDRYKRKTNQWL